MFFFFFFFKLAEFYPTATALIIWIEVGSCEVRRFYQRLSILSCKAINAFKMESINTDNDFSKSRRDIYITQRFSFFFGDGDP